MSYTLPTATDELGETPPVVCVPAPGSTFAIGKTTVTCTATDADDSNSPVTAQFSVTVQGAATQLQALSTYLSTLASSSGPKVDLSKLIQLVNDAIGNGTNQASVCTDLSSAAAVAQSQQNAGELTPAQAAAIITAANRISAVTGCKQTTSLGGLAG